MGAGMASFLMNKLRAIPRRARALALRQHSAPAPSTSPLAWIELAQERLAELPAATQRLIANHDLRVSNHVINHFEDEISAVAGARLKSLVSRRGEVDAIAEAIEEIVKRKTIIQCAYAHRTGGYFSDAEPFMAQQWETTIWPIIEGENFEKTLDLACGHGRNTEFLRRHACSIELVDVNESCISACKERFGEAIDGCRFRYHLTDGDGLPGISENSLTFVYSWDSMVHFDKIVVRDYVKEIFRVLQPGGTAFLHHSNLGSTVPDSDWAHNVGTRSDMSGDLMRDYAKDAGLNVKFQRLSGRTDGWGQDDLDCLSLLQKPV
jgi:SAM-dependent methyltransferase